MNHDRNDPNSRSRDGPRKRPKTSPFNLMAFDPDLWIEVTAQEAELKANASSRASPQQSPRGGDPI